MEIQKPINIISADLALRWVDGTSTRWGLDVFFKDRSKTRFRLRIAFAVNERISTKVQYVALVDYWWFFPSTDILLHSGGQVERQILECFEEWWGVEETIGKFAHVRSDLDCIKRAMDELRRRICEKENCEK